MGTSIYIIHRFLAVAGLAIWGLSSTAWAVEEPVNGLNQPIQGFQTEWRLPVSSMIQKSPSGVPESNVNLSNGGSTSFHTRGEFGEQMRESAEVRRPINLYLMDLPSAVSLSVDKAETKFPANDVGSKKSVLGKLFSKLEFFPNRFNVTRPNDPEGMVLFAF